MTNQEKSELRRLVRHRIQLGYDVKSTITSLSGLGFVPSTVRKYYKIWKMISIERKMKEWEETNRLFEQELERQEGCK